MGAMKRQQLEDAAHDDVMQELRAKPYEMADLFSSFRIDDAARSFDLVRGLFRQKRICHPMHVAGMLDPAPEQLAAAFKAKYPRHEIPLNISTEDPEYLSAERFTVVSDTMHALADFLSWEIGSDDDAGDGDDADREAW